MGVTFRRILCAVDLTDASHDELATAARLGADPSTEVTLAHVWRAPLRAEITVDERALAALAAEHERALDACRDELEHLGAKHVRTKLLGGFSDSEIARELTDDHSYDVIVIGTHGRAGFDHALHGSVAEHVIRRARCPVLVVPRGSS